MKTCVWNLLRAAGLVSLFVFTTASIPTNGIPTNGIPTNGIPTNGIPTNGIPTNGIPTNGIPTNGIPTNGVAANLDALENSLLFGNRAVHTALISKPFTQASLTDGSSPVFDVWFDSYSVTLLSYLWQNAHPAGDDLTFAFGGQTFRFYGNLGLCKDSWASVTPLDESCARWMSALIVAQVNQSGIHNLFSARGPSNRPTAPGFIGPQLTDMAPGILSFDYRFGTHDRVAAFAVPCPAGTTGPENCGWQPGFVGTGTPGTVVDVTVDSKGNALLVQVNQGIMGHDYPWAAGGSCEGTAPGAGCTDGDVLAVADQGTVNPLLRFTVPSSGVFNVQWTAAARDTLNGIARPGMGARVVGTGLVSFPANELDVFPRGNREMTSSANIFGEANIDPALWSCEARPRFRRGTAPTPITGAAFTPDAVVVLPPTILCLATNPDACTPCERPFREGAQHVVFPNAHLWLSRGWNNAQAYYQARSCSANLSTCIATFEGYIDAFWLRPAPARSVPPCLLQSFDTDSFRPLPYAGTPRPLGDANLCFIGWTPTAWFTVTTFFPNYRDLGACAAIGPSSSAACAYTPPRRNVTPCDDD